MANELEHTTGAAPKMERLAQVKDGHKSPVQSDSVFNSPPGDKGALQAMHDKVPVPLPRPLYADERDQSWRGFQPDKSIQALEGPAHQWNPKDRPPPIEQIIARDHKNDPKMIGALKEAVDARAKGDKRDLGDIFLDKADKKDNFTGAFAHDALDKAKLAEHKMKFDFAAQKLAEAFQKPGEKPPPGVTPLDDIAYKAPMGMVNPTAGSIGDLARALADKPSGEYVDKLKRSIKIIHDGMK